MPLRRIAGGPLIRPGDLPDLPPDLVDVSSVFNPGAARDGDRVVLLLRVQTRGRETFLLRAAAREGFGPFVFDDAPLRLAGVEGLPGRVHHVYDPRLTRLEGDWYCMVAVDIDDGCRLGLARSHDLAEFEWLGLASRDDARNGVLFPEKVGGRYLRLDRPNRIVAPGEPPSGDAIRLSASDDLLDWEPVATVLEGRPHSWDERVGPGPPPLKTRAGWLVVYHGVATHFGAASVYQAGAALLDLADPGRVLARSRRCFLEPREPWERVGQVPNVVFPTGLLADAEDADGCAPPEAGVLLYYGAADSCVGLATGTVADLLDACAD